jgi:hypothetical protein
VTGPNQEHIMTATMPTRIIHPTSNSAPQLIIIESSAGTRTPPPTPRLTIGQRAARLIGTVVALVALLALGIIGAVFTALWVITTLVMSVVRGRGRAHGRRSGPIVVRATGTRPTGATRPTRSA